MPDDTAPETPQDDDQGLDQSMIDALLRGEEDEEPAALDQSAIDALLNPAVEPAEAEDSEPVAEESEPVAEESEPVAEESEPVTAAEPEAAGDEAAGLLDQAALDELWAQANAETEASGETTAGNEDLFGPKKKSRWTAAEPVQERTATPARLTGATTTSVGDMDLLADVTVTLSVEIGRTELTIEDLLKLGPGALVELHKMAGEPVEIFVNDRCIARGEVVVVDDNFGVRITELGR